LPAGRPGRLALLLVPEWTESGEDRFIRKDDQPQYGNSITDRIADWNMNRQGS